MSFELLIAEEIDRVFSQHLASPAVDAFARSGSFRIRLLFSRSSIAEEFLPSFVRDDPGEADLEIGFLTSAEADLSHLIPDKEAEYRTMALDEVFAVWHPSELPMLYLLNRKANRALIWLAAGGANSRRSDTAAKAAGRYSITSKISSLCISSSRRQLARPQSCCRIAKSPCLLAIAPPTCWNAIDSAR